MNIKDYVAQDDGNFEGLVRLQAEANLEKTAVICEQRRLTYAELNRLVNRLAAALQRDGVKPRGVVAICAATSIEYLATFLGVLRAGATVAPLSTAATAEQLAAMVVDCGASHLFVDADVSRQLAGVAPRLSARQIALNAAADGDAFPDWLAPEGARPAPVTIDPDQAFNIIYSSGTTGTPKGIVQSQRMRWYQVIRTDPPGYTPEAITILSTPLYSNTTLTSLIPTLAGGGTLVLMPKFDARQFLVLCEAHRVNVAMLVPVQYRRILAVPNFDRFDLSNFRMKFATSAPFPADLKSEVLRRWPGGLIEYYGMTEGGGTCMLLAHEHPDKLHTVGQPIPGHDMKVIDDEGRVLPPGQAGEVVGRSESMMNGYHNRPDKTAEAEWISPEGLRYIRTGDIATIDADGFMTLIGRKKDMIISGGINVYPIDLERALIDHPAVHEAAVVGAPSAEWGETPVAFITLNDGASVSPEEVRIFANAKLGKMQRISEVRIIAVLPRSAIGKVLKRELQDQLPPAM
ncbi:MAG: class I adenylate-forming enzyme family protein [Pseudomonadota bacterium]